MVRIINSLVAAALLTTPAFAAPFIYPPFTNTAALRARAEENQFVEPIVLSPPTSTIGDDGLNGPPQNKESAFVHHDGKAGRLSKNSRAVINGVSSRARKSKYDEWDLQLLSKGGLNNGEPSRTEFPVNRPHTAIRRRKRKANSLEKKEGDLESQAVLNDVSNSRPTDESSRKPPATSRSSSSMAPAKKAKVAGMQEIKK